MYAKVVGFSCCWWETSFLSLYQYRKTNLSSLCLRYNLQERQKFPLFLYQYKETNLSSFCLRSKMEERQKFPICLYQYRKTNLSFLCLRFEIEEIHKFPRRNARKSEPYKGKCMKKLAVKDICKFLSPMCLSHEPVPFLGPAWCQLVGQVKWLNGGSVCPKRNGLRQPGEKLYAKL